MRLRTLRHPQGNSQLSILFVSEPQRQTVGLWKGQCCCIENFSRLSYRTSHAVIRLEAQFMTLSLLFPRNNYYKWYIK